MKKKYLNTCQMLRCVEFKGFAQFLRRGDFIITDAEVIKVPVGVVVTEIKEVEETKNDVKTTVKKIEKLKDK